MTLTSAHIRPDTGIRCEFNVFARTYPGPCWPFGMAQPGPDNITGWDYTNGYSYDLRFIEGFSMMRLSGTGWYGDFGCFQVMPTTGPLQTYRGIGLERRGESTTNGWHSEFYHRDETIEPGYYAVRLHRYNIYTELTATRHGGLLRFTFPEHDQSRIQVDLSRRIGGSSSEQEVRVVDDHAIEGWMRFAPDGGGMGNGAPKDLNYKVFFRAEFNQPMKDFGIWEVAYPPEVHRERLFVESPAYAEYCRNAAVHPGRKEAHGQHLGFYTEFPSTRDQQVLMKVGLSFVDLEGARANLAAEIPHWDFEGTRDELLAAWDRELSRLQVKGAEAFDRSVLATAMYHTGLDPRYIDDVDGRFADSKGSIKRVSCSQEADDPANQGTAQGNIESERCAIRDSGCEPNKEGLVTDASAIMDPASRIPHPLASGARPRTVFSGWDVFRSFIPLKTLTDPELVNDQINTLLDVADTTDAGFPKWELMGACMGCMVGDPAVGTIVDAYVKGIRDFDVDKAYALCLETAFGPRTHRNDWERYLELGYCPGSMASTLENAYYDWCICSFAKALGREDDVKDLKKGQFNYRNIYCPEVGLMRAKDEHGDWIPWEGGTVFGQGCREANPLQQTWFVPHDPQGLMDLMGEEHFFATLIDMFEKTPDSCFWNPYYNHSNEHVHQLVYIFSCVGRPWLTQKYSRWVMKNAYQLGPEGLCGNDDVGQLSAWYVLSAMGIHPFCTGSGMYCIGSPLFGEVELALDAKFHQGDALRIIAHDNAEDNIYIQHATINGEPLDRAWVTHQELTAGCILEFQMGPEPNEGWASSVESRPPSLLV